jgi:hypothetical protein
LGNFYLAGFTWRPIGGRKRQPRCSAIQVLNQVAR